MSNGEVHYQCHLQKGDTHQVTWLPKKFAVEGRIVKLYDEVTDSWEDGWLVTSVGTQSFPSKYIAERSRDYTQTRKASDI